MIISFILVTLLSDSGVILLGRNYMLVAISLVSQLSQIQKSIFGTSKWSYKNHKPLNHWEESVCHLHLKLLWSGLMLHHFHYMGKIIYKLLQKNRIVHFLKSYLWKSNHESNTHFTALFRYLLVHHSYSKVPLKLLSA